MRELSHGRTTARMEPVTQALKREEWSAFDEVQVAVCIALPIRNLLADLLAEVFEHDAPSRIFGRLVRPCKHRHHHDGQERLDVAYAIERLADATSYIAVAPPIICSNEDHDQVRLHASKAFAVLGRDLHAPNAQVDGLPAIQATQHFRKGRTGAVALRDRVTVREKTKGAASIRPPQTGLVTANLKPQEMYLSAPWHHELESPLSMLWLRLVATSSPCAGRVNELKCSCSNNIAIG